MAFRRIRRDGNSLIVTISPDEAAKARLTEGTLVDVYVNEDKGIVEIQPITRTGSEFVQIGRQIIEEDRHLLDRLAQIEPDSENRTNGQT